MTFAAAERAYLTPPEPCCEREDCDGVRCWEERADRHEDYLLAMQEEREGR